MNQSYWAEGQQSVLGGLSTVGVNKIRLHHVFLLGLDPFDRYNITKESEEHGDILQGAFLEGYYNLTLKDHQFMNFVKGLVFENSK